MSKWYKVGIEYTVRTGAENSPDRQNGVTYGDNMYVLSPSDSKKHTADPSQGRNANISKIPSSKVCAGSTSPPLPSALIQSESSIKHHIQCRLILWQGSSCDSQPIKSSIVEGLFLKPTAGGSKVAFADEAPIRRLRGSKARSVELRHFQPEL